MRLIPLVLSAAVAVTMAGCKDQGGGKPPAPVGNSPFKGTVKVEFLNPDKPNDYFRDMKLIEPFGFIDSAGMNWDVTYISGKFLGTNGGTTANAIKAMGIARGDRVVIYMPLIPEAVLEKAPALFRTSESRSTRWFPEKRTIPPLTRIFSTMT